MKRLSFVLVVLMLSTVLGISKIWSQTVTIIGSFDKPVPSDILTVYEPVDGFFNVFYADSTGDMQVENGRFGITLPLVKAGFFRLQSKSISKTYFYAEPNDTIVIRFVDDKIVGEIRAVYSGNNASANNLLADKKLFNNGMDSQNLFATVIANAKSADEAVLGIKQVVEPQVALIGNLREEKSISKTCADAFTAEAEQKALAWCSDFLSAFLSGQTKQKLKMSRTEVLRLISKLYAAYDPYLAKNRVATTNYTNAHQKAQFVMEKIIAGAVPPKRPWRKFDSSLGMVVSKVGAIDFAPPEVQEFFVGQSLLTALAYNSVNDSNYREMVGVFAKLFPRSGYLPLLNSHLQLKQQAAPQTPDSKHPVYRKDSASSVLAVQGLPSLDTVTSVQSLVKHYFKGKPLFVDFWASWCSPCIAEFKHADALHSFLESKGIATLYVSIDKAEAKGMWEKMANRFGLIGYHYLVNPQVYRHTNQWFQAIPRYMLFDADGRLLDDDLPRPSKREELYDRIGRLVSTK